MRAAKIVRIDIFQMKLKSLGSLTDDQYKQIPTFLTALIQMITGGMNIKTQTENNMEVLSAVSSISQLMVYNSMKRRHPDAKRVCHNPDRETQLPLYMALHTHTKTRKQDRFDHLLVCPTNLCKDLFTTAKLDNLNHNPSSTLAQTAHPGTGSNFRNSTCYTG